MKKKVFLFYLAIFMVTYIPFMAHAQSLIITGKVQDANSADVLIGVSVFLEGATVGTQTNAQGQYTIEAPVNSVLIFRYIGYEDKKVTVTKAGVINVGLIENTTLLEEAVVVGYGSQVRKEITGSVQTISAAEMRDIPVSQVTQKLQGKVAGVQINTTSGKPGAGMSVRIRGQLSVSGGSEPLYVVDGFPISGNISNLNPDEIEDISILKDAASTSLYGSRAANGVVLVTTKRGKAGQSSVSFNAYAGLQEVPMKGRLQMMDAVEFAQFKKESFEDEGKPVPVVFQNPSMYEGKNNDWYGALLRTAPVQSYNLTMTSNKDNVRSSIIAGVLNQDGVLLNSHYKRYSVRMNTDYDVSQKVKIGFNLAPSYINDNTPRTDGDRGTGILFNALHTWPIMPIYKENGELTDYNVLPAETGNIFPYANWLRSAGEITNQTKRINVLSNAFIEFKPIEGLVLKSSMNAEIFNSKFLFFNPSTATNNINVTVPTTAVSIRENFEDFSWLNENIGTYTKSIDDHNFELLGGFTIQRFRRERMRVQADTYADDRIPTIQGGINLNKGGTTSGVDEWGLLSALSRVTYNYKRKYLFTASIRSDGSSRFGSENRWGTFPSVSAGWVLSDENFLSQYENNFFAKIRASYGITGNNNIGNYTQYALINNTVNAVFGDRIVSGAAINSLSNSNLGWERTRQFDIGLDLGFFGDKVQVVYDYYKKKTTDLLYNVQIAQESGYGQYNDNIGEIDFWGHEFSVTGRNTFGELNWSANANISFNRNKVIALADGIDRVYGTFHITQVGQPFGQFYGLQAQGVYLNQADLDSSPQVPGRSFVGTIKIKDTNGDGVITYGGDNDDRVIIGNPFPKFMYGISNTFRYKKFDLSIVGSGSHGNQLFVRHIYSTANLDGVFNMLKEVKYRFRTEANPGKGMYGTTVGGGNVTGVERDWVSSRFVTDASYFTIKNITLGYDFKVNRSIFQSVRMYSSVQNAWVFTKYWGGQNPEVSSQGNGDGDGGNLSSGIEFSSFPVPRVFTIGFNFNF